MDMGPGDKTEKRYGRIGNMSHESLALMPVQKTRRPNLPGT